MPRPMPRPAPVINEIGLVINYVAQPAMVATAFAKGESFTRPQLWWRLYFSLSLLYSFSQSRGTAID